jgi:hypothetical protein
MQYALTLPLSPPAGAEGVPTVLQSSEKRYSFSQAGDAGQGNTKILFLHLCYFGTATLFRIFIGPWCLRICICS